MSNLDGNASATTAGAEKARRGKMTWLVAGAAVLALGAGSMAWLASEGEKEIVLAGTAPLPSSAAPAAALASEPVSAPAAAEPDEVSTAAILEDTPVIPSKPADKKAPVDELSKMFESKKAAPVHVAAKPPAKKPVVAVAKTAPAKAVDRPAAHPTAMASNIEPVLKKKAVVAVKVPSRQDSDVALLAALVAHSKAMQPKHSAPAAKLQQCKTLPSVAEAEQCRARLCATSAKSESECKAPKLAKASSES